MKILIISDTHDNMENLELLMNKYLNRKPDYIIHLGDIDSPFMIPILGKLNIEGLLIKGNNDGDTDYLGVKCFENNIKFVCPPYHLELEGKKFLLTHKPLDEKKFVKKGIDYYLFGHTHISVIERGENDILRINPGTLGGHLTGKCTYAILDTELNSAKIYNL
ncbi:metallophosphoesterase [candidate division WOR-3 bacterium]|jgi:putative phosphoesterase|nr:metallophosphoesterase [candidate division WOR-3 bacterium]